MLSCSTATLNAGLFTVLAQFAKWVANYAGEIFTLLEHSAPKNQKQHKLFGKELRQPLPPKPRSFMLGKFNMMYFIRFVTN